MKFSVLALMWTAVAAAADWTAPVEVVHDTQRCLAYRARVAGGYLLVEAAIEPGWHTFALDNKQRADEKLAGKKSLGQDRPTEIKIIEGLEAAGGWLQTPPKDASKPELRWFTWTFENKALFAVKIRRTGDGPAKLGIRGQACTETICKNIDVSMTVALAGTVAVAGADAGAAGEIRSLIPVRQ